MTLPLQTNQPHLNCPHLNAPLTFNKTKYQQTSNFVSIAGACNLIMKAETKFHLKNDIWSGKAQRKKDCTLVHLRVKTQGIWREIC
jgi:hypothetical protein